MESTVSPNITTGKVSTADALWSLIAGQPKSTRRSLAEKFLSEDFELVEQLLLKASIHRGWQQVKALEADNNPGNTLQDLIDELKTSR